MTWECRNGIYIKDGNYLEPIQPNRVTNDSYAVADALLGHKLEDYRRRRPLLLPLGRGGFEVFLSISGTLRSALVTPGYCEDVDYVPIKISRYTKGKINAEGELRLDETDIEQAARALEGHEEGIIIDDIADKCRSIRRVLDRLPTRGKNIVIATPYTKPEAAQERLDHPHYFLTPFVSREIDDAVYPPWVVFHWERDEHDAELWRRLFPELYQISQVFQEAGVA